MTDKNASLTTAKHLLGQVAQPLLDEIARLIDAGIPEPIPEGHHYDYVDTRERPQIAHHPPTIDLQAAWPPHDPTVEHEVGVIPALCRRCTLQSAYSTLADWEARHA